MNNNFKLLAKKIVTQSNILSAIRREYRYLKTVIQFRFMKQASMSPNFSSKMKKYKNIHKGEKCFIIGNGPSLTPEDLDKVSQVCSFATNRIYLMYEKTNWRPTYYMCQDRQLIRSLVDYYSKCEETVFLGYQALYEYGIEIEKANYYLADNRNVNKIVEEIGFSDDAGSVIIDGGSVTYSAIQLAVYMGFSEIYLLGVDHNFSHTLDRNRRIVKHEDVKQDYFDSRYKDAFKQFEEKGKTYAAPDKDLMDKAFAAARKYCDKNGIIIKNATRGGKLEAFERINFDDIWKE